MYAFFLLVIVSSAAAHKFEWGRCQNVNAMENFEMEKFQGKWFVMKKMKTKISCMTDHFSILPEEGNYNFTERQQVYDQVILNEAVIQTRGGQFVIDYPLIFPDSSFKVVDTDYDTYAIIYKCQPLPLFRRWSVSILSRKRGMLRDTVDKLERQFNEATSIDTDDMNYIDHSDCVSDDDALFTVGIGPGLSIKPGGQAIDSIADGFRGLSGDLQMPSKQKGQGSNDNSEVPAEDDDFEFF